MLGFVNGLALIVLFRPTRPAPTRSDIHYAHRVFECARKTLVNQDLHPKLADDERLCQLECPDGSFFGHSWEIIEKLVEGLSAFEVIQQGLKRNAGTPEHRRFFQNVRIPDDDFDWSDDLYSSAHPEWRKWEVVWRSRLIFMG